MALASLVLAGPVPAGEAVPPGGAAALCNSLKTAVRRHAASGPVLLQSYLPRGEGFPRALENTAFTYDNALAVIALVSCDETPAASQIGTALLRATEQDRHYTDGRLRNAYRAGPQQDPLPPGYWDPAAGLWVEDGYQVGTTAGNMAWAALAFIHLGAATADAAWDEAAKKALYWIEDTLRDPEAHSGYFGGVFGFEGAQDKATWKSTEHNLDIEAAARLLGPETAPIGATASRFVSRMWHGAGAYFLIGTTPDGRPSTAAEPALDAQVWTMLARPEMLEGNPDLVSRSLSRFEIGARGVDFNTDLDGIWTEGTAQAALLLRERGLDDKADAYLQTLWRARDPASGWMKATDGEPLSTGLSAGIGAETDAMFVYYPYPHLGATAWSILALHESNPFFLLEDQE